MNPKEALGLPPGSVRAILALILVLAIIAGAILRLPTEYFSALVNAAFMALGFYFGTKTTK